MNKRFFLLLIIILLTACTFPLNSKPVSRIKMPSDLPNPIELENKIKILYESEIKGDWRTCYNLTSPQFQRICSFDKFKKRSTETGNNFKIASWNIKNVISIPSEKEMKESNIKYAVVIEMDIFLKKHWWNAPIKFNDQTDYWVDCWVYIDNSWSWMLRGGKDVLDRMER